MKSRISIVAICLFMSVAKPAAVQAQNPVADRVRALGDSRLVYIDDTVLTADDFGAYLSNAGVLPSGRREQDLDTLESSLESLIDQTIIFLELDTAKILSHSDHNQRARWRMANAAGPITYQKEIVPKIDVPESAVKQFHQDSLKTMFTAPQRRELRHLLISPKWHFEDGKRVQYQADHHVARATADSLKRAIEAGASMEKLARRFSADSASRPNGGYIGWVFPNNTVYNFDTAAFSAELGEIRGPVKTMYGYHLIRVEGIWPESTIVLSDSLAAMIRSQLEFQEGRQLGHDWADSMIEAADWKYNDARLEGNVKDIPDTAWVLIINDRDTLEYDDWKGAWEYFKRTQQIEGEGTLEEKHASLRKTGYPYLYLHAAEAHGYADHPLILDARLNYARSIELGSRRKELRERQQLPDMDSVAGSESNASEPDHLMKLQMVRAEDTASIWAAYRALTAGNSMETVAEWYHDDLREVRHRAWDLGWVSRDEIPSDMLGTVWILNEGHFTRPLESGGKYYIYRLVERRRPEGDLVDRQIRIKRAAGQRREEALREWRGELRDGHAVRRDPATWRRIVQVFRK